MRGFFAGMNGVSVAIGYSFATYMGLAFHETDGSSLEWRGPLALAVIFSLIPLASLLIVPESPRYLLMAGRVDEAKAVVRKLHDVSHADEQHFAMAEFYQMQKQTEFDKTLDASWSQMFRRPSYRQRAIVAAGFAFLSQSTAILGEKASASIIFPRAKLTSQSLTTTGRYCIGLWAMVA
jgi:MFS family permease